MSAHILDAAPTLLQRLQSHKGGLIHLKTELFWYRGRGWDKNPGRICLILDVCPARSVASATEATTAAAATAATTAAAALLLVDDAPKWIWVTAEDVEVLDDPA